MKAAQRYRKTAVLLTVVLVVSFAATAHASTQLVLTRGEQPPSTQYKGVIELTVDPGFDDARVTISIDGQKVAESLQAPYRLVVDFGPTAVEHKIAVVATGPKRQQRIQWHETINHGHLPLTVRIQPVDYANHVFEAFTTAPIEDPVTVVELWDSGKIVGSATEAPFRFAVPAEVLASGFIQVTARTKSGEEAADFWSANGEVHAESIEVRTVPIFVSVVDNNGNTRNDVDRSLFRVLDNGSEAKILEFGKAFDQPISIALLLDASASMTYSIERATKAALGFVQNTMKRGDHCSVYAVQEVPRRRQALTDDSALVAKALLGIRPSGQTALYDAIDSAVRELRSEKNRRAIVVLTDGGDTASIDSYDDVKKIAGAAGIPIYFIAYDTGAASSARDVDLLKNLAADTGGFVATATEQNLQAKYHEIERDLRAQFAIRYQITDYAKPNQWRPIRVLVASPKLTARTIRGYFTP
ncbi:MAG TPA: VWA domain-containing protein [Thermoanaerobaculia bacterium]|nr:VWA domain-containing protein [Thermoanaerobaculia bacterium]